MLASVSPDLVPVHVTPPLSALVLFYQQMVFFLMNEWENNDFENHTK
jgi:hypothetical protein